MRFTGRAEFKDGRAPFTDTTPPAESLFAETPAGAALKLYWRMPAEVRTACVRVMVGPYLPNDRVNYPIYSGPPATFSPRAGWHEVQIGPR